MARAAESGVADSHIYVKGLGDSRRGSVVAKATELGARRFSVILPV